MARSVAACSVLIVIGVAAAVAPPRGECPEAGDNELIGTVRYVPDLDAYITNVDPGTPADFDLDGDSWWYTQIDDTHVGVCSPRADGSGVASDDASGSEAGSASNAGSASGSVSGSDTGTDACSDGLRNGNEEGVDCGGPCQPCRTEFYGQCGVIDEGPPVVFVELSAEQGVRHSILDNNEGCVGGSGGGGSAYSGYNERLDGAYGTGPHGFPGVAYQITSPVDALLHVETSGWEQDFDQSCNSDSFMESPYCCTPGLPGGNNGYSNFDTYLYLYDDDHTILTFNDDRGCGSGAQILYQLEAGKRYIVVGGGFSGAEGDYALFWEVGGAGVPGRNPGDEPPPIDDYHEYREDDDDDRWSNYGDDDDRWSNYGDDELTEHNYDSTRGHDEDDGTPPSLRNRRRAKAQHRFEGAGKVKKLGVW